MNLNCPECNNPINDALRNAEWNSIDCIPVECDKCGLILLYKPIEETTCCNINFQPQSETDLDVMSWVYICNRDHSFYLRVGLIVDKDHVHYRVQFENGDKTWVPFHWVEPIDP